LPRSIKPLAIQETVEFTGLIPRDELSSKLASANVMALPRADGLFCRAGIPNKCGELLATGRLVVVARTEDVNKYLADMGSAYVIPPGDVQTSADALRGICVLALRG
jgi:glycosyltransferase involved in cell wall biosynthesis